MTADRPISEILATQRTVRSLEFFPPKDGAGVEALRQAALALKRIAPDFVSVTYGAGGSTGERTAQGSRLLREELGFTVHAHLPYVRRPRHEFNRVVDPL